MTEPQVRQIEDALLERLTAREILSSSLTITTRRDWVQPDYRPHRRLLCDGAFAGGPPPSSMRNCASLSMEMREFASLVQSGAGAFSSQHVLGVLAHRTGGLAAAPALNWSG